MLGVHADIAEEADLEAVVGGDDAIGMNGGVVRCVRAEERGQRVIARIRIGEMQVAGNDRRQAAVPLGGGDRLGQRARSEIELVVAQGGHVVAERMHRAVVDRDRCRNPPRPACPFGCRPRSRSASICLPPWQRLARVATPSHAARRHPPACPLPAQSGWGNRRARG